MRTGKNARSVRKEEAEKRNAEWVALSPIEQLAELDKRPGKSEKQRKKIISKMEKLAESTKS